MAIVTLERTVVGLPGGGEAWAEIQYNTANDRITTVNWAIPMSGVSVRVMIYDTGSLVYDRTYAQGSGSENVPGVNRVVYENGLPMLPANLQVMYYAQLVGPG